MQSFFSQMSLIRFIIPVFLLQTNLLLQPMSPQNVSALVITTASKIDICCTTLSSEIDQLTSIVTTGFADTYTTIEAISIAACNLSGTYTLLDTAIAQEYTTQSKVDSLTHIVNQDFAGVFTAIAAISESACDLSGTYTLLNTAIAQEYTTQSKIDSLTNIVKTDFAGTFTAIAAIPATNLSGTYTVLNTILSQEISTQSKLDLCCATLNSKVDSLANITVTDFAGTFTSIAAIPVANFTGTYTLLNQVIADELATQNIIELCCTTLNSKVDSLSRSLNNDFTALSAQGLTTQSKVDLCCTTLNSKVDYVTNTLTIDFAGTFTAIAAIPAADFTETYSLLNEVISQELVTQNIVELCCSTLNSKVDYVTNLINNDFTALSAQGQTIQSSIDSLANTVEIDFAGTFTAIAAIPVADFTETYSLLNEVISQELVTQNIVELCCSTLNSKVDYVTNLINNDFTALSAQGQTIQSSVDSLANTVEIDFAGTFTAIAAIPVANFTGTYTLLNQVIADELATQNIIELCCTTLNSKVDSLSRNLSNDFTALSAQGLTTQSKVDLCCATLNSKIDSLAGIVVADFAGTFTAIAAIPAANFTGTYTLLNSAIAQEYTTQSKVDALTNIVNTDFAGSFTALNALGLCEAIPLSLSSTGTTITASGVYCLTNNVTLGSATGNSIVINAADVVLDLNNHTISGGSTTSGQGPIIINNNRVTVKNGSIVGSNATNTSGITVNARTYVVIQNIEITTCYQGIYLTSSSDINIDTVIVRDSTRYGIYVVGSGNTSITNCQIFGASTAGIFVSSINSPVFIKDCLVNGATNGFEFSSVSADVIADSCTAIGVLAGSGFTGVFVAASTNVSCTNCIAAKFGTGFNFSDVGSGSVTLEGCQAFNHGTGYGLELVNGSAINCSALECTTAGFNLFTSANTILKNCQSMANNIGFDLTSSTSCSLEQCTAESNTEYGYQLAQASGCTIINSSALNNLLIGFFASTAGGCCVIGNCIASNNKFNGFLGNADVTFFNNFAQCNNENFDSYSASSAASGMLDSKVDLLTSALCGSKSLNQTSVVNDLLELSDSCQTYCLSECITGSVIISGSNVSLDLNQYTILGTVEITDGSSNSVIYNGRINPQGQSSDSDTQAALTIDAGALNTSILNCQIVCDNSLTVSTNGRDAVNNNANNTTIDKCVIQAGDGTSTVITTSLGGTGATGINNTGQNLQVNNSSITVSNGGNGIVQASSFGKIGNVALRGELLASVPGIGILITSGGSSNEIYDCDVANTENGFLLFNASIVNMVNCNAQSCMGSGFTIIGGSDIRIQNCVSQACLSDGFTGTDDCSNVILESCAANNNAANGFNFANAGSNISLRNTQSINNVGSGFDFSSTGTQSSVENCVAKNNSSATNSYYGFKSASSAQTDVSFLFNLASSNGLTPFIQNYSSNPIGATSAPVSLITGARNYGDNLSAL